MVLNATVLVLRLCMKLSDERLWQCRAGHCAASQQFTLPQRYSQLGARALDEIQRRNCVDPIVARDGASSCFRSPGMPP
jgi:hypothetical protein